jgi:acyl-[acyl-carrier-protein]-phospholipid O-acyltransferase/long-chain-fatty-acid--[acyl-carrier-protein] ligase
MTQEFPPDWDGARVREVVAHYNSQTEAQQLEQIDAAFQSEGVTPHGTLPPLNRDSSFWGMAATQFLGAFNDNVFKQLILLLATPAAAAATEDEDRQWAAMFVFAGAFLVFSGFAGFLSDRFSKRPVIILAKVAEIVIMVLGAIGFYFYGQIGFAGMLVVLFFMGSQSAFFGPAKYGILPEMLRPTDLPRANGIFLMLTFLAIIFGVALAGALLLLFRDQVWVASLTCIAIAVVGTGTSFLVRRLPPAQPDLKYEWSCWGVSREVVALLRKDHELVWAILVVAIFWMVGGIVQPALNALGKTQLGLDELRVSALSAAVGLGIAAGCMLGGHFSRNQVNPRIVTIGGVGLVATMVVMSLPGGEHQHLLGFWGSVPVLLLMGVFTGMFIVPIQVLLQSRPPQGDKGRMIATMNQFTWIGILLSAVLYKAFIEVLDATGGPRNLLFAFTAAIMLPVAMIYRPKHELLSETPA